MKPRPPIDDCRESVGPFTDRVDILEGASRREIAAFSADAELGALSRLWKMFGVERRNPSVGN
jgi:hypothetical protein